MITPFQIFQIFLLLISVSYQIDQAQKAKERAKKAAEARRGFETVVESEIIAIPIAYGRVKIGGVRAWIATASSLEIATHNSDSILGSYTVGSKSGSKNEYLVFQQALCQGPINQVYDVILDDSFLITETDFKEIHIECHNYGGRNLNTYKNFGSRYFAEFPGLAYTSSFIKIDRDKPRDIPDMSFLIEGRKVRTITKSGNTYTVNPTRVYSNNPAYCMLDYLLEDLSDPKLNLSTRALSVDEIDLKSFYEAAQVCGRIVQSNVTVGGNIWQTSVESIRNVTQRNLPLYECNIIIDTKKPLRENIENILSTMGDARLIWSAGKYKLSLQYPSGA